MSVLAKVGRVCLGVSREAVRRGISNQRPISSALKAIQEGRAREGGRAQPLSERRCLSLSKRDRFEDGYFSRAQRRGFDLEGGRASPIYHYRWPIFCDIVKELESLEPDRVEEELVRKLAVARSVFPPFSPAPLEAELRDFFGLPQTETTRLFSKLRWALAKRLFPEFNYIEQALIQAVVKISQENRSLSSLSPEKVVEELPSEVFELFKGRTHELVCLHVLNRLTDEEVRDFLESGIENEFWRNLDEDTDRIRSLVFQAVEKESEYLRNQMRKPVLPIFVK